ncbi:MAG TPA: response regulator transcription factor [Rhodocyclaceae bacterium]|nr:response regulator transcription factor [Rhodocyclaceae bacterium]
MALALVIEDHPLFRNALVHLIRPVLDVELCLATNAEEGLEILDQESEIRLVVMDLGLPGPLRSAAAVAAVRKARPDVPLLVVSGTEDDAGIEAALAAGATAYVSKSASATELSDALRKLAAGGRRDEPKSLTRRQHEILCLLCEGLSNKEIGRKLDLSDATVKMHMTAILRALGVLSRTQAVLIARSLGLDTLPAQGAMDEA